MIFKLSVLQENNLLNLPETGMGYQIVEANRLGKYERERFIALNSEILIEMDRLEADNIRTVIKEGIATVKSRISFIALDQLSILNEQQFRNLVREPKYESERAAIENPVENVDGLEMFARLSAFDNDRRVDKTNMCLRPGSFTTTVDDYQNCKNR